MVSKKCNISDTTDYNSTWKITESAALGRKVFKNEHLNVKKFKEYLNQFNLLLFFLWKHTSAIS